MVALANQLYNITRSTTPPTSTQIESAFKAYQDSRFDAAVGVCQESGNVTNMATWGTGVHRFLDQYIIGLSTVQKLLTHMVAGKTAKTPRFDFVPAEEKFEGTVAWEQPMPRTVEA